MNGVSEETYRALRKFARRLSLEYPKEESHLRGLPYFVGYVPDDIEIDRSEGSYFYLRGDYFLGYRYVLDKLRGELVLEYLEDRELKDLFWRFVCEIIADYTTYRHAEKLKAKIEEFLSDIVKPIISYEVLVPILNMDAKNSEIAVGKIIIKKFDEGALLEWGAKKESPIFKELVNKTIAIIPEKGNNPKLVFGRAKRKANFIIRLLQTSLAENRFIWDEQLLFRPGTAIMYKDVENPSHIGSSWKRGYEPILTKVDERLERNINDFLGKMPEIIQEKLPTGLLNHFRIAITWIGRAIDEDDPDIKIVYLSTALEAILTTLSDRMKGETLAYRMLLLNSYVDEPFIHPANVLWIYELRSKLIHGSELTVASKSEYYTMKHVAFDTLLHSLKVIRQKGLNNLAEFLEFLETRGESQKILDWLKKQGDERSLNIRKCMEENLKS